MFIVRQRVKAKQITLDSMPEEHRLNYENRVGEVIELYPPKHVIVKWSQDEVEGKKRFAHNTWLNWKIAQNNMLWESEAYMVRRAVWGEYLLLRKEKHSMRILHREYPLDAFLVATRTRLDEIEMVGLIVTLTNLGHLK